MVDGKFTPNLPFRMQALIRGDQIVEEIGAASILAKVTRDKIMESIICAIVISIFINTKVIPLNRT